VDYRVFRIISCGWKCEDTIDKCINSVFNQIGIYDIDWKHYVVLDCCNLNILKTTPKDQLSIKYNKGRRGKMFNFYYAVNNMCGGINDEDIICDVDLDDYLLPEALKTVAGVYEKNPDCLLTYGNYRTISGKPARFNGIYKSDNFRNQRWRASHLKTFKYKLFKRIKKIDFKGKDGRFLMSGSDMALMFPMLEMAGMDRIKYIDKEIYVYNDMSINCDHKIHREEQKRNERLLRSKLRYKKI
jgi:cellulose synthase/poly-beta-1,6-N-acetylglucosamine synthase-like glycosyltransferase